MSGRPYVAALGGGLFIAVSGVLCSFTGRSLEGELNRLNTSPLPRHALWIERLEEAQA
jgi:hypothetical protein